MTVCKTALPFIVVLLAVQAASQELSSTLHSTLYGVQFAFVDETVVFTCVVRGSNNLRWTSDEYIGVDRRVNLITALRNGTVMPVIGTDGTVAVLVNATVDVIIVAELRIRVQSIYSVASIQCVDIAANTVNSTSFRLAGGALVACDRQSVCPGDTLTCACTTGNSNTLAWVVTGTILTFGQEDQGTTRRVMNGSTTYNAVLTERSNRNGLNIIMSILTVSVSRLRDSDVLLICENVERETSEPTIVPIDETCPSVIPSDQVTTAAGGGNAPVICSTCTGSIVGVIIAAIVVIAALVLIILVGVIFYLRTLRKQKKKITEYDERIQWFKTEIDGKEQQHKNAIKELEQKMEEELRLKGEEILRLKDSLKQSEERDKELQRLKTKVIEKDNEVKALTIKMEEQNGARDKKLQNMKAESLEKDKKAIGLIIEKDKLEKDVTTLKKQMECIKEEVRQALAKKTNEDIIEAFQKLDKKMDTSAVSMASFTGMFSGNLGSSRS